MAFILCEKCGKQYSEHAPKCPHCPKQTYKPTRPQAGKRLIECKGCGREISPLAKACPGCGAPTPKEQMNVSINSWITIIACTIFLLCSAYYSHPEWFGVEKKTGLEKVLDSLTKVVNEAKKKNK